MQIKRNILVGKFSQDCAHGWMTENLFLSNRAVVVILIGVFAWNLDPSLTVILIGATPLLAASAFWFGRRLKRVERAKREASAQLASFVHQILSALPIVQAST